MAEGIGRAIKKLLAAMEKHRSVHKGQTNLSAFQLPSVAALTVKGAQQEIGLPPER
jgi:hypothetical protein